MGSFNTGKSTLINQLLNREICPEDSLPKTSALFYLKYGEKFTARTKGSGKPLYFPTEEQFLSFINNKTAVKFEQVEITINHPLLKKCTLVDTPGIDSVSSETASLEKLALQADKIIYLFHQRGIDELNKQFLTTLAKNKKLEYRDISFWINCNLGKSDGTSLGNTREVLKNIFRRSPEIYLLNSHLPESVDTLRHYLEVMISKDIIRDLSTKHREIDEKIPARVHKSLLIQDDMLFLDTLWDIKKQSEKILLARDILNNLPRVEEQIKNLLNTNHHIHILPGSLFYSPGRTDRNSYTDIPAIKEQMSQLASRIMHDTGIRHLISPHKVGKWAGILNREEFKVVAVGGFSSGKSTFFNAIMGENLLPAENRPTTGNITYIKHGTGRKAVITFKPNLRLKICTYNGPDVIIREEEMRAAVDWLTKDNDLRHLLKARVDTGKGIKRIEKAKLLEEIKRTQGLFTSGSRNGRLDTRGAGTLYRPLPAWKARAMAPVWEITLYFKPTPPLELNLETTAGKKKFKDITTSREAFRIEDITIFHPAHFLKTATFVDTPGLDSTNSYHSALTTDFLQRSDAYLFFLNGKHILNRHDSLSLLNMFKLRLKDYLHTEKSGAVQREMAKFFFIINFADTLTPAEREKARNYLQRNLVQSLKTSGINTHGVKIFPISPLQALQGRDNGSFSKLLQQVQLAIWNYRGKEFLKEHLHKLRSILETATTPRHTVRNKNQKTVPGKFSTHVILRQGLTEIKNEIQWRFNIITGQVERLKQPQHFKTFTRGTPQEQRQVVTHIKNVSYFRWLNAFNRRIEQISNTWQKSAYRTVESWLNQAGISPNPYSLPPSPPYLEASKAMEQMEETVSKSRNFYGGFKAKEAKQKILILLREQERNLSDEFDRWQHEMEVYLRDLISPVIIPAVEKHSQVPQKSYKKQLSREESMILNNYMTEIKNIDEKLNTPGGI